MLTEFVKFFCRRRHIRRSAWTALIVCPLLLGQIFVNPVIAAVTDEGQESFHDAGIRLFEDRDYRGAIIQLRNELQRNPNNVPARVLLGRAYNKIGAGADAERELNNAERLGAEEAEVAPLLGRSYLLQKRYKDVLARFPIHLIQGKAAAEIFTVRGDAYLGLKDYAKARESFEQAIARSPDMADPWLGLAQVSFALGRYEEAQKLAGEATRRRHVYPEAWYLTGELYRHRSDYDRAINSYKTVLEQSATHKAAYLGLATIYLEQNKLNEAKAQVDKIKGWDRFDPWPFYLLSVIHARQGNQVEAQIALTDAAAIVENSGSALGIENESILLITALVHVANKKYTEATQFFERYLEVAPKNLSVRKLYARVLLGQGNVKRSIEVLEEVRDVGKKDVLYFVLLGAAYVGDRKFKSAARAYELALALDPENPELQAQIAMGKLMTGATEEAVKQLGALNSDKAKSVRAALLLAMIHMQVGEYDKAQLVAQNVLKQQPDNAIALDITGVTLMKQGKLKEARALFEGVLKNVPQYDPMRFRLAEIDQLEGNVEKARERYSEILSRDSGNAAALSSLALLADATGQTDQTISYLNRLQSSPTARVKAEIKLINILIARKRVEEALNAAQNLRKRAGPSINVLLILAKAQIASGKLVAARETLKQTVDATGGNRRDGAKELIKIAYLQNKARGLEAAKATLRLAIERYDRHVPAYEALIGMELRGNRIAEAEAVVNTFLAANPDSPFVNMLRGDLAFARGELADAQTFYSQALLVTKTPALMKRLYLTILRHEGQKAALEALERWIEKQPGDQVAKRTYAVGLIEAGRIDEAISFHEKLIENSPDDAGLLNNLALLYHRKSDRRALPLARRAVELAPREAAMLDTYGWLLVETGQAKEGLEYLRKAKRLLIADPRVEFHYAAALAKSGDVAKAKTLLNRLLEENTSFEGVDSAKALFRQLSDR